MQPFNVEIFDRDFNFIHNYTVEDIEYHEDYLTLPETVVFMSYNENVKRGNYIRAYNDEERYEGIITSVTASAKYDGFMNVGFKSLIALFRATFVMRVAEISQYATNNSLEKLIYDYVRKYYVLGDMPDGHDDEMQVPGLSLTIISNTYNWNIGLVADMEYDYDGSTNVSLIDSLIIPAMEMYKIGLYVDFDFQAKAISIEIGIKNSTPITVEANLPNILNVDYNAKDNRDDVNTVCVMCGTGDWNVDPQFAIEYYKNTHGVWSGDPTDRILPPIYSEMVYNEPVATYNPNGAIMTGGQDVLQMLVQNFGGTQDDNNIEITVKNDDPLAYTFALGDTAKIILNDTEYISIYTGKDRKNGATTLIFGTIRMDLTKILKRRK